MKLIQVTAPALIFVAVVGYLGIHTAVQWIAGLVKGNDEDRKDEKRKE